MDDLDVHAEAPTLTVSGRTIALPDIAADSLRSHKVATRVERLKADPLWEDNGLVFASEDGTPLDPTNLRRTFARIATKAGVDARFVYALPHTATSLLVDGGAALEQVADLLGDDPGPCYATTDTRFGQ